MDRSPARRISDGVASAWLHSARSRGLGRVPATSDPDEATKRTVQVMCEQIASSSRVPGVQQFALNAVRQFHGGPLYKGTDALHDPQAIAVSCWFWAKNNITFEHHEELFRQWLPEDAGQLQLLISPDVLVRLERKRGDCAIFTELICAFLKCLGVPFEIVTVAVNPDEPEIFSHVYARAVLPSGQRFNLDASHGPYPGWKVPSAHTFRQKVWDENGIEVPDMAIQFKGLHAYRPQRRGLGADSTTIDFPFQTSAGDVSEGGTYFPPSGDNPTQTFFPAPSGSSGSGTNWGAIFGNELAAWTKIASNVIAPQQTYSRGPNGQLLITGPAGAAPIVPPSTGFGGSSLLWIGAAVVGVMVVANMAKK